MDVDEPPADQSEINIVPERYQTGFFLIIQ